MKFKADFATPLMLGLISVFMASCASNSSGTYQALDNPTFGQAIVKGQPNHLKEFDTKFKEVLGNGDLEAQQIGCVEGCDKFGTLPPITRIVYVFPREYPDITLKFGKAWDAIQKSSGDKAFALEFDGDVIAPDCGPPRVPQPCQSMPFCSDRCGRKPANCNAC